jgi:hypothetical protein
MAVGTKNCAFLTPVQPMNLKFITRKSSKGRTYLSFHLLQAFDKKTRWVYGIALTCTVLSWYFLIIVKKRLLHSKEEIGIVKLAVIVISSQSLVSVPIKNLGSLHHRIFLTVLFVFALIKCNAFQGSVVSRLTSPPKSNDINTLDELLRSEMKLKAMIAIPDLFKPNRDESNVNEVQKKIHGRMKMEDISPVSLINITEKDAILSESVDDASINFKMLLFQFEKSSPSRLSQAITTSSPAKISFTSSTNRRSPSTSHSSCPGHRRFCSNSTSQ